VEGPAKGQPTATQGPANGQILNKETNKQITTTTGASDLSQLEAQLLSACNGALDNPANCSGLLSLAIPQMWINEGADLQLDILPTLRAVGQKAHGKRINTWNYFTRAVAEAKAMRVAGLPTVDVSARRGAPTSIAEKIKAYNERQNNKSEG
jgi:hypothetical protein